MAASNLLICFCSFALSCPILEKDNLIENVYIHIVFLCYLIKQCSFKNTKKNCFVWGFYISIFFYYFIFLGVVGEG